MKFLSLGLSKCLAVVSLLVSPSLLHAIVVEGCTVGCVTIEAIAFNDFDGNGILGGGELPFAGVSVDLLTTDPAGSGVITPGAPILATLPTGSAGRVLFEGLFADRDFFLRFASGVPFGFHFTTTDVGADDDIDSDVGPDGTTGVCFLGSGQSLSFTAGFTTNAGSVASTPTANCPPPVNPLPGNPPNGVPEPTTLTLMRFGLAGLGFRRRLN